MYCPKCGCLNADDARFCASCGQVQAAIQQTPNAYANAPQASPAPPPQLISGAAAPQQPVYYANPQQQAWSNPQPNPQPAYQDPRIRTSGTAPGVRAYAMGKNPGLAVFLSFLIPGLGQFYCGANGKGGIMLAIYFVSWLLVAVTVGVVGVLAVWIWSMIDAYNLASGKIPLS